MSTVVISGLDSRTTSDLIHNYCQNYGRVLNCYVKSNQCTVTFADKHNAEEFVRASPHRIDSHSFVNAAWKTTLNHHQPSTKKQSSDNCRLTIRGTFEQLEEKNLVQYFSNYGRIRMCLSNPSQGYATVTLDDRIGYENVLKEPRHFLNGRSLIVEPYKPTDESESNKRRKLSDPNETKLSSLTSQLEYEKEQLINEKLCLENQFQERIQLYEYEKQQLNAYIAKQQQEFSQQIGNFQYLLQQSLGEINNKDKQIEQLKRENKDIDDLLRQSLHDNEQQQIHIKKREDVHNQTKRKYEDLYKAYMKLKDSSVTQRTPEKVSMSVKSSISSTDSIVHRPTLTVDDVRRKL